jgi:hypothetical protein
MSARSISTSMFHIPHNWGTVSLTDTQDCRERAQRREMHHPEALEAFVEVTNPSKWLTIVHFAGTIYELVNKADRRIHCCDGCHWFGKKFIHLALLGQVRRNWPYP